MVSRSILITGVLLISALSQVGCCSCHKHSVFRVRNSPCTCTPAPKACGCEPVTSYRQPIGMMQPMPEPPMYGAPTIMQPAH